MRRFALTAFAAALLAVAVPSPAGAHSFGAKGPPHQHLTNPSCTASTECHTWILANGAIIRGRSIHLSNSYGYVLVRCSSRYAGGSWFFDQLPFGPWNNIGSQHPYCLSPTYGGIPWSVRP